MKIINEKGKLFGTINLFDLLILLLIIAVGIFGFLKVSKKQGPVAINQEQVTLKMWVKDVRMETVEAVLKSETAKEYETGLPFGSIESVTYEPYMQYVDTADGRIVKTEVEGKYDMYITLKADAIVGPNQITIATKHVGIGRHFTLTGKYYGVNAVVLGVELDESGE